jgi:hypothetical protein
MARTWSTPWSGWEQAVRLSYNAGADGVWLLPFTLGVGA